MNKNPLRPTISNKELATNFIAMLLSVFALCVAIIAVVSGPKASSQPAQESQIVTECPPPTNEGAYFERGKDKDGNVICGFAYYDPCPYAEGYPADHIMCEKFKDQQAPQSPPMETKEPSNVNPMSTENNAYVNYGWGK